MFKRWEFWISLAGAIALLAGGVALGRVAGSRGPGHPQLELPTSNSSSPPIYCVKTKKKVAGLTFDIGTGTNILKKTLAMLDDNNLKATFFVSAFWAEDHPDALKSIKAAGQEIGSHGYHHVVLSRKDKAYLDQEFKKSNQIIEDISGVKPKLFRAPYGASSDLVVDTARQHGMETVKWTIDSLDWKKPGVGYIVRRVTKEVFPGAIILFHANSDAPQTYKAVPKIKQALAGKGYTLKPLGELFNQYNTLRSHACDNARARGSL